MISRIYIDNFRCFVNFECELSSPHLLMGLNGTGKTSLLYLLESLCSLLIQGATIDEEGMFTADTLTAWETQRNRQKFEIDISGNGGTYTYRLEIEHDRKSAGTRNRISLERLTFEDQILYLFDGQEAHLYRDDPTTGTGPVFPFDWSRSFIPTLPERKDNAKLSWFRRRMERIYIFSPDPLRIPGESREEQERPARSLHNLVSWLRHLSQEDVDVLPNLRNSLKGPLAGLIDLKLEKTSELSRALRMQFQFMDSNDKQSGKPFWVRFESLSDGQRHLVALYAILHALPQRDSTIIIDEPDNFLSLREIQPWILDIQDRTYDEGCQLMLISHHPEILNLLAANHGLIFFREPSGPVRRKYFDWKQGETASPADLVAREWE